jgi:hypothetical protein
VTTLPAAFQSNKILFAVLPSGPLKVYISQSYKADPWKRQEGMSSIELAPNQPCAEPEPRVKVLKRDPAITVNDDE